MLKVKKLNFSYGDNKILKDISFEVKRGDSVAIIGPNGSGKSTLINCLNRLNPVADGMVYLKEKDINLYGKEFYHCTSTLFQNPENQFVTLSVEHELAFTLENRNVARKEMKHRVKKALETYHLGSLAEHAPDELSGGEKQLAALASALIDNPEIFFLDEPTTMLDKEAKEIINRHVFDSKQNNATTVVMVTHNAAEAYLCDRTIVLAEGEIVCNGETGRVYRENFRKIVELGLDIPVEVIAELLKNKKD